MSHHGRWASKRQPSAAFSLAVPLSNTQPSCCAPCARSGWTRRPRRRTSWPARARTPQPAHSRGARAAELRAHRQQTRVNQSGRAAPGCRPVRQLTARDQSAGLPRGAAPWRTPTPRTMRPAMRPTASSPAPGAHERTMYTPTLKGSVIMTLCAKLVALRSGRKGWRQALGHGRRGAGRGRRTAACRSPRRASLAARRPERPALGTQTGNSMRAVRHSQQWQQLHGRDVWRKGARRRGRRRRHHAPPLASAAAEHHLGSGHETAQCHQRLDFYPETPPTAARRASMPAPVLARSAARAGLDAARIK